MPLIKNTGHLWHRKYVDWLSGNQLIGISEKKPYKVANFADQAGIYVLYDNNFSCVYVGQAGSGKSTGLYSRLKEHAINDYLFCRWERFSWWGFYPVEDIENDYYDKSFKIKTDVNEVMDLVESLIIRVNAPKLNLALGKLAGAEWFYQEAEFEERRGEHEELKKVCESMKDNKTA